MRRRDVILLLLAGLLAIAPLVVGFTGGAAFEGADGEAQALITVINPEYRPWWEPLWEPPSSEIASLMFAMQAALGAGVLGYVLGVRRGRTDAAKRGSLDARR